MFVLLTRVPVSQARRLKCLAEDEVNQVHNLYSTEYPSVWLGWQCCRDSEEEEPPESDVIPTPDYVITTQPLHTFIRRSALNVGDDEDLPSDVVLHRLMDRLQPVIQASSCLQALWFVGGDDLPPIRGSSALYGACLRLTLGLGSSLSIVGVKQVSDYTNSRVWCDVLRCNFRCVSSPSEEHRWSAFQSTLLWNGPLVVHNASLLPCPLHISNFSLRLSEPRGVSTAARNDEESRKELGSASHPGVMSASEACHSRQTRSSVAGAASKRTEKSAKKGGRSSTAATPAGAPSTSTLPIANPVFSRSNSNTASTYSNPVGLEAWILATSRRCYLDVQRCVHRNSLLHCPADNQSVSLLSCSTGDQPAQKFLDHLSASHAARQSCLLARLHQYSSSSSSSSGQRSALHSSASRCHLFIKWLADSSPDTIRDLQQGVGCYGSNHEANPAPVVALQPNFTRCHDGGGGGADGGASSLSTSCLAGWVLLNLSQIAPGLHASLDRIANSCQSSGMEEDLLSGIESDEDGDMIQSDDIIARLPLYEPTSHQFTGRVDRTWLRKNFDSMRTKLSEGFGKLLLFSETPEFMYLKHLRDKNSSSSPALVSTTPTGKSLLDPPVFSDSFKVGKLEMDPSATIPVRRLLGMFGEDGSVTSQDSLHLIKTHSPSDASCSSPTKGDASCGLTVKRREHGIWYCLDSNRGLEEDVHLHKLRDSLNRLIDPSSSAVELKVALSDDIDMLPTPTSHIPPRRVSRRSQTKGDDLSLAIATGDGKLSRDPLMEVPPPLANRGSSSSSSHRSKKSSLERLDEVRSGRTGSARRSSLNGAKLASTGLRRHSTALDLKRETVGGGGGLAKPSTSMALPLQSQRSSSPSHSRSNSSQASDPAARHLRRHASSQSAVCASPFGGSQLESPFSGLPSIAESCGSVCSQTEDSAASQPSSTSRFSGQRGSSRSTSSAAARRAGSISSLKQEEKSLSVKRSDRHKQKLQLVVEHVLNKQGLQRADPLFQKCSSRLFKVSKIYLEDLTTSHNLVAEMKKIAKNNVKQVIQSEFKNAKRSVPS